MTAASALSPAASGIERHHAEPAVRPQDDFFRHVNGGWLRDTAMPQDRAVIGAFTGVADQTRAQLRGLIEQAAADSAPSGMPDDAAQQIGDLYTSFMDEARCEQLGLLPLAAEWGAAQTLADASALGPLLARWLRRGIAGPLGLYISPDSRDSRRQLAWLHQSGLGLPDRDYYLQADRDPHLGSVRQAYEAHLARLLSLAGEPDAEAAATAVLSLETALAQAQWARVDLRDPVRRDNRVQAGALAALAPQIDWAGWLAEAGLPGGEAELNLNQPDYVAALGVLSATVPLAHWRAYLKSRLLLTFAPLLHGTLAEAHFSLTGGVLRGMPQNPPRWERGVVLVEQWLGEPLGRLYVARHFPQDSKPRVERLVGHLLEACGERLALLDWMEPETRREALAKLAAFSHKIGHPDRWTDTTGLRIDRNDLVGNAQRAAEFRWARDLARLASPVDRSEWLISAHTVNAYYHPTLNEVVFPAAILQPPFFDVAADDAANYGAIGAVIGHEISHAFDDQGSRYDARGLLRNWWTPQDSARFAERTGLLVAQYGAYQPVSGYALDGRQTLGENIADNAGLALAHHAWQRSLGGRPSPVIDGLSGEQRFFCGFAQIWRMRWRDERLIEQVKAGVHAPGEFRVNGTLRNQPAFHEAYGVLPGDGMYLPPEQRASIW